MTLDLVAIAVMVIAALLYAALVPGRWRGWALLLGSVVALFWLQAPLAPRFADFLLPSATVALAVAGWWLSRPARRALLAPVAPEEAYPPTGAPPPRVYVRDDWLTLLVVAGVILLLSLCTAACWAVEGVTFHASFDRWLVGDIGAGGRTPIKQLGGSLAEGRSGMALSLDGQSYLEFPAGADAPTHKDAETLPVDPLNGDIYVITKRTEVGRVYRAPFPQSTTQNVTLEFVAELPWGESGGTGGATGGDVSIDRVVAGVQPPVVAPVGPVGEDRVLRERGGAIAMDRIRPAVVGRALGPRRVGRQGKLAKRAQLLRQISGRRQVGRGDQRAGRHPPDRVGRGRVGPAPPRRPGLVAAPLLWT